MTGTPAALAAERAIVLCASLEAYPWLRETEWTSSNATARPPFDELYIVAFSIIKRRADGGPYRRRLWYVKRGDEAAYGPTDWPIEAVASTSIAPRQPSRLMGRPARGPRG